MCSNSKEYIDTIRDYSFDAIKKRIDSYKGWNDFSLHRFPDIQTDWTITGWEPTLNPQYFEILSYIREQFPSSRIVQLTHGDNFASEDFTKKISSISNYHICVPLHGYNASTHEAIVRKKWSFQALMKGIINILKYKQAHQHLEIRIIIQKMNYQYLDKMYYLIQKFFPQVDTITTIMMEFEWQAIDNIHHTKVSYSQVMQVNSDIFLKWWDIFGKGKFRLYHFPLCVVKEKRLWPYLWRTLPAHEITFLKSCMDCEASRYCMGLHEAYADYNSSDEFLAFPESITSSIREDSQNFRFHPIDSIIL
jgi:MoaA/NifB/PqqE/SkfB family radical SAM enzyme